MKINSGKLKRKVTILPRFLAKHSFGTFLALFFLSAALGGFIFYFKVVLVEQSELVSVKAGLQLKEGVYSDILNQWKVRDYRFKEAEVKQYINPFSEERPELIEPVLIEETATNTEEATSSEEVATSSEEEIIEEALSIEIVEELLNASNVFEFYLIRDGKVPLIAERAVIWEEMELGSKESYYGAAYQNRLLLSELKKELTDRYY